MMSVEWMVVTSEGKGGSVGRPKEGGGSSSNSSLSLIRVMVVKSSH